MFGRALFCLICVASISACGTWEHQNSVVSPDGKAVASVEVQLLGAPSSNRTKIKIDNANGGKLILPGEVVSANSAIVDATRITWVGANELRVLLCEATEYQVRARLLRDPVTLEDGSENAILVKVENGKYSQSQKQCVIS